MVCAGMIVAGMVVGCAGNGPATVQVATPSATTPVTVRGTVAYRERMALPADATVDVWITDIGSGIVAMAILSETTVTANGRQVPLPFELTVDPSRVNADRPYGIRAVIRAGGEVIFESRAPMPVLTQGHPTTVALMLARPASASAAPAVEEHALHGTTG